MADYERFTGYGTPALDFSGLAQLPQIYRQNQLNVRREQVLSELGRGTLDYGRAATALLSAGDTEGGLSLARLAEARSNRSEDRSLREQEFEFRKKEAERSQANTETDRAERIRQFNLGQEGNKVPAGYEADPNNPGALRFRTGGPQDPATIKAQNEAKIGSGLFSPEAISELAKQARAGDNSVFTNIGRGAQGGENLKLLREEIVRQNTAEGLGGADQAIRNAEYFGARAGARTVAQKGANIELAATEFNQVLPVVQEASKAVNRTNYPDLNKIIQAYNEKTGDPNIVKFGGGINTLVNLYARAISPNGVGTVNDKEHAREVLQKAWSQGQFDAAVGMMKQEIDAALASPEKVREDMRKRFLSGTGANKTSEEGSKSPPATSGRRSIPPPPAGSIIVGQ